MRLPTLTIRLSISLIEKFAALTGNKAMHDSCQHAKANKQTHFEICHLGPR